MPTAGVPAAPDGTVMVTVLMVPAVARLEGEGVGARRLAGLGVGDGQLHVRKSPGKGGRYTQRQHGEGDQGAADTRSCSVRRLVDVRFIWSVPSVS